MNNNKSIENKLSTVCNHNYNDINNTLIGIPSFKMVYPTKYSLRCTICGDVHTVEQSEIKDLKSFLHKFFI